MWKRLLAEVKEFKWVSVVTPICMLGEVIAEMVIPRLMARIVDDGIDGGNMGLILRTGGIMIVVALTGLVFGILGGFFAARASAGFARNLRKAMFHNIQTFSFSNIDKFSTSGLVTRLTTDVTNIQNAYQMVLRMAMRAPSSMIIAMIMSFTISVRLSSIYLVAVLFLICVAVVLMKRVTVYFKQVFERYDDLNESVQENVTAIRVVKAFVREDHEVSKFRKAAGNIYLMFIKAEKTMTVVMPIMMGTVYTCILLISYFGARMVVVDNLSTGDLMSLLTYCMNILMSLMMVSMVVIMITMSSASAKRIAEVLEEETTIKNPENPVQKIADGSITMEDVWFSYNDTSEEPVLKDIDIKIAAGESVGIIGATGSAKSSLVSLISRLYDVSKGSVKVGGVDVRDYDLTALRDAVAVVLQKNELFTGTIYDNLRWGDSNASDEDCREAARLACADEFIRNFPDGYETKIEQGGSNVSGGQKQRLCIARALLKKPKILILDDSTSAVDTATDARIRQAMRERIPDTTKLVIAQRIASVMDLDRILVMDDGKVNGFGTHAELMETNEIYRELYESQTSGARDFDEAS